MNELQSHSSQPGDLAGVRRKLEENYARSSEAMQQRDIQPLLRMVTPDFSQVLLNGQEIRRDQLEATFADWSSRVRSVKEYRVRIEALSVQGDEAIAKTTSTLSTTLLDPTGAAHEGVQTAHTRDTWTRTDSGWLMQRSENLSEQLLIDGVPAVV